jgi:hypothetical protein
VRHRDLSRTRARQLILGLRELLNTWDPIGIGPDGGPPDEYDCLIGPMLGRWERGADACELAEFLRRELDDHFGLDPEYHVDKIERVSRAAVELLGQRRVGLPRPHPAS